MALKTSCAAVLAVLALTGSAAAETPDVSNGRYTMSPVDGGFLRLDKQTGAVAMCARSSGDWACNPVQDHTAAAPSNELSKLEEENEENEKKTVQHRILPRVLPRDSVLCALSLPSRCR